MFNFDVTNGYVMLRIICGLFIIPHAIGKIRHHAGVSGFFETAGFKPVKAWVYAAMVIEWVVAICLILGVFTLAAAVLTALFMFVAAAANSKVQPGKWLWNLGGSEYPVFWGLCCAIVAWAAARGLV